MFKQEFVMSNCSLLTTVVELHNGFCTSSLLSPTNGSLGPLLPWDIEMTVEESVSDDDDGLPHRVSDSQSEFESEQDSD
jgi:hypothetical protein